MNNQSGCCRFLTGPLFGDTGRSALPGSALERNAMVWNVQENARRRSFSRAASAACTFALRAALVPLLLIGSVAHAGLGDAMPSAKRAAISAQATTTSMPGYDRTETTTADGNSIREYAARDGTVFAVDFSGPTMPDLKAVLGTHYDRYVAAATARRGSHHVVSFSTDDAVITIVKLPRGFSGHAHLPAAVPAGVDVQTLR